MNDFFAYMVAALPAVLFSIPVVLVCLYLGRSEGPRTHQCLIGDCRRVCENEFRCRVCGRRWLFSHKKTTAQ